MSVASSTALSHRDRRIRYPVVAATAVALGASILLAPSANAADKWGPGYLIPDTSGKPDTSHIGAYGKPGSLFPNAAGQAYCADPTLEGPEAGGQYGPVTTFTAWTSKTTGKPVPAENVARAAYVLSTYGSTTDDAQAAAVDAAVYTYLDPGTTYALPTGQRALQRLGYPNVPATVKNKAETFLTEAAKFAGPYTVNIHTPKGPVRPGEKTPITLDVTSASGAKLPNVKIHLDGSGAADGSGDITTNSAGTASASITATKDGTVDLTAEAATLPANQLRAQIPGNASAQRMVVAGGTSAAKATAHLQVKAAKGSVKVTKTASDTNKALSGVEFEIRDKDNKTVASGKTDAQGQWTADGLAPGTYTVHEAQAVEGYQLAADQSVSVGDLKTSAVAVTDTPIPQPAKPKPRPVTITQLPKTGA
ncbi:SpaA isopeptide-forming pilin-related protein [Streptomyces sp. NPDC086796]|uniref:SpaA isopeptide-forming pilin-related protein n=1 Tax=Streptomyces sp. NPDC086796 TaxID=3365760 RepID=UPI00381A6C16